MIIILIIVGTLVSVFMIYKILFNPLWGIAMVIFVTPLEPFFINYGGFAIGRVLATFTTLIWVIYLGTNQMASIKLNHSSLLKMQLFFLVPVLLSGIVWYLEPDGERALNSAFTFVLLGAMALMIENLVVSKKDLILIALALSLAGVLASLPANMYFLGYDIYTPLGVDAPTEETEETLRASTLGGNPNSLGILARNGFFACVLYLTLARKNMTRIAVWAMLLICFSGIVLSGSRTNFYGTLIMVLFLLLFGFSKLFYNGKRLVLIVIGFAVIGYAGFQLVPEPVQKRLFMGDGDKHIEKRSNSRLEFTQNQQKQSLDFLGQHPIFGIGLNRTYFETGNEIGAHDTISVIVGETGLLGTLGFIVLFFWAIKKLVIARNYARDFETKLRITLLMGLLISMLFMGGLGGFIVPYDRTFWMTLALIYPVSSFTFTSQYQGNIKMTNQVRIAK